MRLLLTTIILTLLAQPVWADEGPVTFDCELKRVCELSFNRMDKQQECHSRTSTVKKELIYLGNEPFWFGDEKFNFDNSFLHRTSAFSFAGTSEKKVILGEASEFGNFIFRITFFKYGEHVTVTDASHQQTVGYYWTCKE